MLRIPSAFLVATFSASTALASTSQSPFEYVHQDGALWRIEATGRFRVNPSVVSVRFLPGIASLDAFRTAAGEQEARAAKLLAALRTLRSNRLGIHDLEVGAGDDVLEVVALLRSTGLVDFAEENVFGSFVANPNDPGFAQQWALRNVGQNGGIVDADVDGDLAWDLAVGAPAIVVAELDSGTEVTHSDLAANTWHNPGEVPNNGIDDDGNGHVDDVFGWDFPHNNGDVTGPFWHGTAVTGLVSASTNNGLGVCGLAGGFGATPGCRSMSVQVGDLTPDGSILDDSVLYALDEGARVITMSLTTGQSMALEAALLEAWQNQHVFVDCAAGNTNGGPVTYPALSPFVVSAAGTNSNDVRASFSAIGPENWIAAPAEDMYMTSIGNSYISSSGTSFSAPLVAAAAGLVYSVLPNTSNESVKEILKLSADDIVTPGFDNESGWGRLNAAAAVQMASSEDCNDNGVWDTEDIASGASTDTNANGVPDECECRSPSNYCIGAPNSNGPGSEMSWSGSNSVQQNDLVLLAQNASSHQPGVFYYGSAQLQLPFGNGFRCAGGSVFRLPPVTSDSFGDASYALDLAHPPQPAGQIDPGDVWYFQFWYRDPQGGGANFNLSDGLRVPFCP